MLARLEIAVGVFVVALFCVLAGYAIVTALLVIKPGSAVHDCIAQSAKVAAETHRPVAQFAVTRNCERLLAHRGF